MIITYFPETDSLHIRLKNKTEYEGEEVAPGVVFHFDKDNELVSIEMDSMASKIVDRSTIELKGLPFTAPHLSSGTS